LPRRAVTFFLDKKSNQKNQDSGNASFAAQGFARIMQNHGPQEFAPAFAHSVLASGKFALPFPPTSQHRFA
jgi:hypothetical protein